MIETRRLKKVVTFYEQFYTTVLVYNESCLQ